MKKISMSKKTNLTVEEAFEIFIRKCKVRNLSDQTIRNYNHTIIHFIRFIESENAINSITVDTVDEYVLWLKEHNNINEITCVSYLRALRVFLYYCMDCNYLTKFTIMIPKTDKKLKETYTNEEIERLPNKPKVNSCSFAEYRTWVFENHLLGTGNRISTALNVCISDLDFDGGMILLRKMKNRKQQVIPLSRTLSEILQEYLTIRGGEPEDYLFCNEYGQKAAIRSYQDLVKKFNVERNVNKTSCHLFRHTFAKNWIIAGGDVFRLQKILGHSDLTITREYVQMFGTDLMMDFEKFNPLDRLSKNQEKIRIS